MEINFSSASEGAMSDLGAAAGAAEPTPQVEPNAPQAAEPVQSPTDPTSPAEPEYEFNRKGELVKIKASDPTIPELLSKGHDYTQKTMEHAEQVRAFEAQRQQYDSQLQQQSAELTQRLQALDEVMNDPAKFQQLVAWQQQQRGMQTTDPSDIPTIQQTQQLIQSQVETVQRQLQTDIMRAKFELETGRLEQEYSGKIGSHLESLTKTHPILQDVEGIDRLLRDEVAAGVAAKIKANPNVPVPLEDTLQMFSEAAKRRAAKIEERFQNRMKAAAAKKADVITTGIEPPGGAAPTPTAGKVPKIGSKELHDQVLKDLLAAKAD